MARVVLMQSPLQINARLHIILVELLSPRIWTRKSYRIEQLEFAPHVVQARVHDINIKIEGKYINILQMANRFMPSMAATKFILRPSKLVEKDGLPVQSSKA